jgi:uncharacterized protein YndB with AHSA1/START domain
MRMTSQAVDVAVPPERLFAYLTNPDTVRDWQPELVGQHEWLTEGGLREGARFRATVDEPPRGRFDVEITVVTLTPPERIVYHAEEPTSSVDLEWRITRQTNGSQVQLTVDFRLKGFLRPLAVLARPMIRRKLESRPLLLRDAAQAHA